MFRFVTGDGPGPVGLPEDRRKLITRLIIVQYSVVGLFVALALAFWYFQVVEHPKFREMAENNHQRTLGLRAPRGVLFDRGGRALVENRDSFVISVVREHSHNLDHTIQLLAQVLGVDEATVREVVRRHRSQPSYRPIPIVEDATLAQVAAVTARRLDSELPDVLVERVPTRHYPTDALAAHLFGYVGEVTEGQLVDEGFHSGDIVGQAGVEKVYNKVLMGTDGARRVVVNSVGREIRTLDEVPPSEGRRVQLTIDYDVQRATEDAFKGLGYSGSAIILDPRNGEILAYTSLPAYDPNSFAAGIKRATWSDLNSDKLKPLQNRGIQGRYSPGSTFKMVVATAALEEGVITPDFRVNCVGSATFFGRPFQCWSLKSLGHGHGALDLEHAIEQSCNVYFYTLGNMVGIDKIAKWAKLLGLGEKTGIDLPNELQGIMPSPEWKKATTGEKWYAGETISVSIGQGQVSVTPVSMAVYISTIANGGTRHVPHLVRAVDQGRGWQVVPPPPPKSKVEFKPETLATIHQGLWMVVNGAGTGGNARMAGRDVAGKTGTAQVISLQGGKAAAGKTEMDLRDNGWFVFFAPRDNPEIAGAVFAEHALHGAEAARVARFAMETYFAKKEGRPLPQFVPPPQPAATPAVPVVAAVTGGVRHE
ncbi:MAG TPA: penicillin-binding protein 2 [Vicinamibacterales bacterium]|jgi:penicillin-binding protein 2